MNFLDWAIVVVYLVGMIVLSVYLSKGQKTVKDYYLGGNKIKWWQISLSTMATQCSTNSLLGAPAFVAFAAGGGLVWLQYELAVPLAMIFIMIFLFPFYRKAGVVSVYEYLELRFGVLTRTVLSVLFQFLRAFSTGITVYGISLVVHKTMGLPMWQSIFMLAVITIIYDSIGGIKAVIASDVIQLGVLVLGVVLISGYAVSMTGGLQEVLLHVSPERMKTLDFGNHGFGDGKVFAFWPMLLGGFLLYVSYYGCDQTQVQRELSSTCVDDSRRSLFMNGILRFPLVLSYCFAGVAIGAFAVKHPEFLDALPLKDGIREINLATPMFVLNYLPHGIIGLIIVALFSAAMSSLDSTINSLSATSMRDIYERFIAGDEMSGKSHLLWSKGTTVFWGVVCTAGAFMMGEREGSIIVFINQVGSLINGPILGTFLLAILTKRATDIGATTGLLAGFVGNLALWKFAPGISWLWWNLIGFLATFGIGYLASLFQKKSEKSEIEGLTFSGKMVKEAVGERKWQVVYLVLAGYFVFMLLVLAGIGRL